MSSCYSFPCFLSRFHCKINFQKTNYPFKWVSECVLLSLDDDISVLYRLWGCELYCGASGHSSVGAERRAAAASVWRVPGKLKGHCRAKPGSWLNGDDPWLCWTSSQACLVYRVSYLQMAFSYLSAGKAGKEYCAKRCKIKRGKYMGEKNAKPSDINVF